jgi:hypothetical protein
MGSLRASEIGSSGPTITQKDDRRTCQIARHQLPVDHRVVLPVPPQPGTLPGRWVRIDLADTIPDGCWPAAASVDPYSMLRICWITAPSDRLVARRDDWTRGELADGTGGVRCEIRICGWMMGEAAFRSELRLLNERRHEPFGRQA